MSITKEAETALEPPTFDNLSEFPPEIRAYLESDQYREDWLEAKAESERLDRAADPLIARRAGCWHILEFTPEEKAHQGGDPDIAFISEVDGWVVRMDYAAEIGNGSFFWRSGHEAQAVEVRNSEPLECGFSLGSRGRLASAEELETYGWALDDAVRDLTRYLMKTGQE